MRSKADETFVIVETLICFLQSDALLLHHCCNEQLTKSVFIACIPVQGITERTTNL